MSIRLKMEREPNPMRAFEGLTVETASLLARKMGYRVIISGVAGMSSRVPDYPKLGEIGLFTHAYSGLVQHAMLGTESKVTKPKTWSFDSKWPYNTANFYAHPARQVAFCSVCNVALNRDERQSYLNHLCSRCQPSVIESTLNSYRKY